MIKLLRCMVLFGALVTGTQADGFNFRETTNILTSLIERTLGEKAIPSISIALVKEEEVIWTAAFGYANVRAKTPATTETLYNVASTAKSLAASAILQLAEEGALKLEDPVNNYLGGARIHDLTDQPVTFIHLLSHWSGLTPWPGFNSSNAVPIWKPDVLPTLVEIATNLQSIRPPARQFQYNNSGYALAGLLVERISGKKYQDYVGERILQRLDIANRNSFSPSPEMVERIALPYESDSGGIARPVAIYRTSEFPAGNAFLTPGEMATFLGALVNNGAFRGKRILSSDSIREMQTPRFGGNYGLGLRIRKGPDGNTMIRHAGSLPGYSSLMIGDVDAHVGVYGMSNGNDLPHEIADAAIMLLRGEKYPPAKRRAIPLAAKTLEALTGKYRMGNDTFTITRDNNQLFLQKNDQPKKAEICAQTENLFYIEDDPSTVTFDRDRDGQISRLVITDPEWLLKVATKLP